MIQINRLFIGFSIAFYIFLIVFFGWFYDKNDKNFFKWKEDLAATLEDYKLSDKTIEIFLKTTYFLEEEQYYLIDRITYNNYF